MHRFPRTMETSDLENLTNEELIARSRAGERKAFAALYERWFDRVYDFAFQMVGDRQEAADVSQATFLKAMNGLGYLRDTSQLEAWLLCIARHTALNRMKEGART